MEYNREEFRRKARESRERLIESSRKRRGATSYNFTSKKENIDEKEKEENEFIEWFRKNKKKIIIVSSVVGTVVVGVLVCKNWDGIKQFVVDLCDIPPEKGLEGMDIEDAAKTCTVFKGTYNFLGDMYKTDVVSALQEMGYDVRSVHALNMILEKMDILKHYGNDWLTTDAGVEYTIYRGPVYNADGWHPSIVQAVADFLDSTEI